MARAWHAAGVQEMDLHFLLVRKLKAKMLPAFSFEDASSAWVLKRRLTAAALGLKIQ